MRKANVPVQATATPAPGALEKVIVFGAVKV